MKAATPMLITPSRHPKFSCCSSRKSSLTRKSKSALMTVVAACTIVVFSGVTVHAQGLTGTDATSALAHINSARATVVPSAADMTEVRWDSALAAAAHARAAMCNASADGNSAVSCGESCGQITGVASGSVTALPAMATWDSQKSSYVFASNSCNSGATCSDYTQMVSAVSRRVGCALAVCGSIADSPAIPAGTLVVCNFAPNGNIAGQTPYSAGSTCSSCPVDTSCNATLCSTKLSPPDITLPTGMTVSLGTTVAITPPTNVALASATAIRYTTDGSTPTVSSTLYSSAITLSTLGQVTISALSTPTQAGILPSAAVSATYTVLTGVSTPSFSPSGGEYTTSVSVTISCATVGATVMYTTDGSTPTTAAAAVYAAPIVLGMTVNGAVTIQAIAVNSGMAQSATGRANYTVYGILSTPSFTPAASGAFYGSVTVTMATVSNSAVIRYHVLNTSNDTQWYNIPFVAPSWKTYSAPVTFKASDWANGVTVLAIATPSSPGFMLHSARVVGNFSILPAVEPIAFHPPAGYFVTSVLVTLSTTTAGAAIYYTTDGTTPSVATSSVYASPITLSAIGSTHLSVVGVKAGVHDSIVDTQTYIIDNVVSRPTFTPAPGSFVSSVFVTISSATTGSTTYYTTDGSTPTTTSLTANAASPLGLVEGVHTITAFSTLAGRPDSGLLQGTFTVLHQMARPVYVPNGGHYIGTAVVTIASPDTGATIYFVTDGTTPTTSSQLYTGSVTLGALTVSPYSITLRAIALRDGAAPSDVSQSGAFIVRAKTEAPVAAPATGTYSTAVTVTLTSPTPQASVFYTTDGTTPTAGVSTQYSLPLTMNVLGTYTIRAVASADGQLVSDIVALSYIVIAQAAPPQFSPSTGTFVSFVAITLSTTTAGSTVRYTTDGNEPTAQSPAFVSGTPIIVSALGSSTVAAATFHPTLATSTVTIASFVILARVAAPSIQPASGASAMSALTVTLTTPTASAAIYYTTDGTAPSPNDVAVAATMLYTAPFTITQIGELSVSVVARALGMGDSVVAIGRYTIIESVSDPVITPSGGSFINSATVTMHTTTVGAVIEYTLDAGAAATYTGPVTITGATTHVLVVTATKPGAVSSSAVTATFVIQTRLPIPTMSPSGGTFAGLVTVTIAPQPTSPAGTALLYTTDGTPATGTSTLYVGIPLVLTVPGAHTLSVIAVKTGHAPSLTATGTFVVTAVGGGVPTMSPAGGNFIDAVNITVSLPPTAPMGVQLVLTSNGADPRLSADGPTRLVYNATSTPASVLLDSPGVYTLKAAVRAAEGAGYGGGFSELAVGVFTVFEQLDMAAITPSGGAYVGHVEVTISVLSPRATIHFVTDGSDVDRTSQVYTQPFTIGTPGRILVSAVAVAEFGISSVVSHAVFTIVPKVSTPTFTPGQGVFNSLVLVTMVSATPSATIYYTTTGDVPLPGQSAVYTAPIAVARLGQSIVSAIADAPNMAVSDVKSAVYQVTSAQGGCNDLQCAALPGYGCVNTEFGRQCAPVCGDGRRIPPEECDDGNRVGGDGCSSACIVEARKVCSGGGASSVDVCGCEQSDRYGTSCEIECISQTTCSAQGICHAVSGACICQVGAFGPACSRTATATYIAAVVATSYGDSEALLDPAGHGAISVPAGATPEGTAITARTYLAEEAGVFDRDASPDALGMVSSVVTDLRPDGLSFSNPATIRLSFDPRRLRFQTATATEEERLAYASVAWYDQATRGWTRCTPSETVAVSSTVATTSCAITHFSLWAVVEYSTPNPLTTIAIGVIDDDGDDLSLGPLGHAGVVAIIVTLCLLAVIAIGLVMFVWWRKSTHRLGRKQVVMSGAPPRSIYGKGEAVLTNTSLNALPMADTTTTADVVRVDTRDTALSGTHDRDDGGLRIDMSNMAPMDRVDDDDNHHVSAGNNHRYKEAFPATYGHWPAAQHAIRRGQIGVSKQTGDEDTVTAPPPPWLSSMLPSQLDGSDHLGDDKRAVPSHTFATASFCAAIEDEVSKLS